MLVVLVILIKHVVVEVVVTLLQHEYYLRLQTHVKIIGKQLLSLHDRANNLDEHFISKVSVEHIKHLCIGHLLFLLMVLHLLKVPPYL
jgi:hypothetical protein